MTNKQKLKQLGVWKQFKANTKSVECSGIGMKKAKKNDYKVRKAFLWHQSPEGEDFWGEIGRKMCLC